MTASQGTAGVPRPASAAAEPVHCPAWAAIQVLQEKWVLHIVRSLLQGPQGFNELGRAVGGCNPATLRARLEHLERLGVVDRQVQSVMPPRTQYSLTASGVALQGVVEAIDAWARAHLAAVPPAAEDCGSAA